MSSAPFRVGPGSSPAPTEERFGPTEQERSHIYDGYPDVRELARFGGIEGAEYLYAHVTTVTFYLRDYPAHPVLGPWEEAKDIPTCTVVGPKDTSDFRVLVRGGKSRMPGARGDAGYRVTRIDPYLDKVTGLGGMCPECWPPHEGGCDGPVPEQSKPSRQQDPKGEAGRSQPHQQAGSREGVRNTEGSGGVGSPTPPQKA